MENGAQGAGVQRGLGSSSKKARRESIRGGEGCACSFNLVVHCYFPRG